MQVPFDELSEQAEIDAEMLASWIRMHADVESDDPPTADDEIGAHDAAAGVGGRRQLLRHLAERRRELDARERDLDARRREIDRREALLDQREIDQELAAWPPAVHGDR